MPILSRHSLALWTCLAAGAAASAQDLPQDRPAPLVPARPASRKDLDRREALKRYGLGLISERDNRLLEAVRHFEAATRLDPESVPAHKSLIPLYLALDRTEDALAVCRRVLDLDASEFETWYLSARLHRDQGRPREAIDAMAKALACPKIKDQPDLVIQIASDLGQLREEAKDVAGALTALRRVAGVLENPEPLLEMGPISRKEIDAKAAEVYEHIGTLCLQQREHDQAVAAFVRAQQKNPEMAGRLNLHLARICSSQDKPADALRYLDAYLQTQPQGVEGYELKIALLQRQGRGAEVLTQLKDHAARDSHNLALQLLLARQLTLEKQWGEAETAYTSIIREAPGPEAYRGLFELYRAQGKARLAQVLTLVDQALAEASPRDEAAAGDPTAAAKARAMLAVLRDDADLVKALLPLALGDARGRLRSRETARLFAVLAVRTRQLAEAEQLYRDCLPGVTARTEGDVYGGLLEVLTERRKFEDVVAVCRKGLKETQATNRALFHAYQAQALVQLGKMDEAVAEADQVVALANDEDRVQHRLRRARILSLADRHEQAVAECLDLLKGAAQPGDVRTVRYTLSTVYSAARRQDKAEEQLRLILEADPNDDAACNDLGYIMADRGKDLEEAEGLIRKAIRLEREQRQAGAKSRGGAREKRKVGPDDDQDHAAYIDSLGWVLFRRGQVDEARKELEKAAALPEGEDPVIWDHLGDVYLRLDEADRARAAWKKAAQLYEVEKRRKRDEQYRELQRKLKLLDQETQR